MKLEESEQDQQRESWGLGRTCRSCFRDILMELAEQQGGQVGVLVIENLGPWVRDGEGMSEV